VEFMENTRTQKETRVKKNSNSYGTRNYRSRYEDEENDYKKSIFTLRIIICIGIITSALLIKEIDSPLTNNISNKIKTALSENVSINELYEKVSEKISAIKFLNDDEDSQSEYDIQEDTKKNSNSKKLVPTIE